MKYTVNRRPEHVQVEVSGPIDENSDGTFTSLAKEIGDAPAVFDCARLTHLNSLGAKHWMTFFKRISSKKQCSLENCPDALAGYIHMIPQFCGSAKIKSMTLGFHCSGCSATEVRVVTAANLESDQACSKCKEVMTCPLDLDSLAGMFAV